MVGCRQGIPVSSLFHVVHKDVVGVRTPSLAVRTWAPSATFVTELAGSIVPEETKRKKNEVLENCGGISPFDVLFTIDLAAGYRFQIFEKPRQQCCGWSGR